MNIRAIIIALLLGSLGVFAAELAHAVETLAAVPNLLHYQANLKDASGLNVNDDVSIKVLIYDSPTLGTPGDINDEHVLYAEEHDNINVDRGWLRFTIGEGTPQGPFAGSSISLESLAIADNLYLELHVDSELISPRQVFGFQNAAFKSQYTRKADELLGEFHITANNLPDVIPASKVTGELSKTKIPPLTPNYLSGGQVAPYTVPSGIELSKLTSGSLAEDVIPEFSADKVDDGKFDIARMPDTLMLKDDIGFSSGIVLDGAHVSPPPGFSIGECAWIIGFHSTIGDGVHNISDLKVYVGNDIASNDYGTEVHCEIEPQFGGGTDPDQCNAEYLMICKH